MAGARSENEAQPRSFHTVEHASSLFVFIMRKLPFGPELKAEGEVQARLATPVRAYATQ